MGEQYPDLGQTQPKNLWKITDRELGTVGGMEMPIDPKEFGRRLKEVRKDLGFGQEELGEKSGYSQTNIGWLEQGKAKDPRIQAQDLAPFLNTTAQWLLHGTGERYVEPPPMSAAQIADGYESLPPDVRKHFSDIMSQALEIARKKRKRV